MALPKIEAPKYSCVLPLSKLKVDFRPFLSQEERILLMASESKSPAAYLGAMKDIVEACTYGKVAAQDLAPIDLEFLFLNLRMRAVGETVTVTKECKTEGCPTKIEHVIPFESIKYEFIEEFKANKKIEIGDGLGIILKAPSAELASELGEIDVTQTEKMYRMIKDSIELIYDTEQTYQPSEYSDKEMSEFIDQLPVTVMRKIGTFFEQQPKMVYSGTEKCNKCQASTEFKLEGMADFFT